MSFKIHFLLFTVLNVSLILSFLSDFLWYVVKFPNVKF